LTGIIVTLQPSHLPYLKDLHAAGMTMVRLNGSHNTVDWHGKTMQAIRSEIPNTPILLDIPGRKLRLAIETILPVEANQILELPIPIWIPQGTTILFDDGKLTATVISENQRTLRFHQNGELRPRMSMNIPGITIQGPLLTKRDLEIIDLAQALSVDYLDLGFYRILKINPRCTQTLR